MKTISQLSGALTLVLLVASPSLARVATIETTASLTDHSPASIHAAFDEAVRTAARGAVAMGLPHLQVRRALVMDDAVIIQLFAADSDVDDEFALDESDAGPDAARPGPVPSGGETL